MIKKIKFVTKKDHRSSLVLIFFLSLISTFIEMIGIGTIPLFATIIINPNKIIDYFPNYYFLNEVLRMPKTDLLIYTSIIILSIFFIKNLFIGMVNFIQLSTQRKMTKYLYSHIFSLYLYGKYEFHLLRNSADLTKNITTEAARTIQLIFNFINLFKETLIMIFIFITLFLIDPLMTGFIFINFVIFSSIFFLASKAGSKNRGKEIQHAWGLALKILNQSLGSIKILKIFNKEKFMINLFKKQISIIQDKNFVQGFLVTLPRLFLELVSIFIIISISVIYIFRDKPIENFLPLISLIVVAAARLIPSFNIISRALTNIRFQLPSLDLIVKEINLFEESQSENKNFNGVNENRNLFKILLEIKNISFAYPNTDKLIIENFSFKIKKGDFVGVSGNSGSGKSTLIDLISGLLNPQNGEILLDNINIKKYGHIWRNKIGYVPQDTYLLDESIKKNIAFGEDVNYFDEGRFKKSIKFARLNSLVNSFSEKENKIVGEKGIQLSGGQRQRIGIARAIYLNPEIIILDEPTSSLDKDNEKKIIEDLFDLNKNLNITILLVSHKESLFRHCNRLIRLK